MVSVTLKAPYAECRYAECLHAECCGAAYWVGRFLSGWHKELSL